MIRYTYTEIKEIYYTKYLFNIKQIIKHGLIQVPDIATIDVDTEEDYLYAKWRWENLRN